MQEWVDELYLRLHPEKTRIIPPGEAFVFLGHTFQNGEVTAPERRISSSQERKPPKAGWGPPQVCSIVKGPKQVLATSSDEYWRDGMTTLYITEQGSYLRVKHKQFQVFYDRELRCAIPASRVTHVVMFGVCNVSHGAVRLSLQRRIPLLYLSNKGRYFGRLQTTGQAKLEYLIQQVQKSQDPEFVRTQAASVIVGKLHNSRILLLRLNRRRKTEQATQAIAALAELIQTVPTIDTVESMLGYEGNGASLYFQAYASLLKGKFEFERRTRRPPDRSGQQLAEPGLYAAVAKRPRHGGGRRIAHPFWQSACAARKSPFAGVRSGGGVSRYCRGLAGRLPDQFQHFQC